MFPSAEEATEIQLAEGAVVTVQFCAITGMETQLRKATFQTLRFGLMAARHLTCKRGSSVRCLICSKAFPRDSAASATLSAPTDEERSIVLISLIAANLVSSFIPITPARVSRHLPEELYSCDARNCVWFPKPITKQSSGGAEVARFRRTGAKAPQIFGVSITCETSNTKTAKRAKGSGP